MKVYSFLLILLCLDLSFSVPNAKYCPYEPTLVPEHPNDASSGSPGIYFYIPIETMGLMNNSIFLYDDNAVLVDCMDKSEILEISITSIVTSYFTTIKYITNNLHIISYAPFNAYGPTPTSKSWLFIDDYFKLR